jgi:hypothetical protein
MPQITSKLDAPNVYTDHANTDHGKAPSVTIAPGVNNVTDKQLATLRKVPAYVAHEKGGYVVEGKSPTKAEAEAAAKAAAEAEAAAKELDDATKLAAQQGDK